MPNPDLLDAKLESLQRCVERIVSHTPPTAAELAGNHDAQDIVAVNLQRAIQILVDLAGHLIATRGWSTPSTMTQGFTVLAEHGVLEPAHAERLARVVGFRNISVHEYEKIDWRRVFSIVTTNLDDLRASAAALAAAWDAP